jgi:hypothetical protein
MSQKRSQVCCLGLEHGHCRVTGAVMHVVNMAMAGRLGSCQCELRMLRGAHEVGRMQLWCGAASIDCLESG